MREYTKILTLRAEVPADKEEFDIYASATKESRDEYVKEGREQISAEIGCDPEHLVEFDFRIEEAPK